MIGIEIKIWANPNGFTEVTEQLPSNIFTEREKKAFNPDALDPIKSKDYFSIFYAQNSYVVSYHFYVSIKSSKIKFRDDRTVISIAIPRSYSFEGSSFGVTMQSDVSHTDLLTIFTELRKGYEELVNGLFSINDLGNTLRTAVVGWINQYSSKLIPDDMQPLINTPGSAPSRGYVLYRSSEDLKQFLKAPVRLEFKGASMMLLLPSDANQLFVRDYHFQLVNAEPQYKPKFSVYFPDYKNDAIAIIESLEESIDLMCERTYCEPIHLKGRFADHINDWNIQAMCDKSGYTISLKFKPQEYRLPIIVDFYNRKREKEIAKNVESWLFPSEGRIESKDDQYVLVLTGNPNVKQIIFSSKKEEFYIKEQRILANQNFYVCVDEVFVYNPSNLKRIINSKYGFVPQLYLFDNNRNRWLLCESKFPCYGYRRQYKLKIAESEGYEECVFPMETDESKLKLEPKPDTSMCIIFKGAILKWLEADSRRNVFVQECIEKSEKKSQHHNIVSELAVNLSVNTLSFRHFDGEKVYCFKARGFKTVRKRFNASTKELEVNMSVALWKRLLKSRIVHMLICLIVGFVLGWLCCKYFPQGEIVPSQDPAAKDSIEQASDTTKENEDKIKSDTVQSNNDASSGAETNNPGSEPTNNQSGNGTNLESVIDKPKLDGIDYNNNDLSNAIEQAKKAGIYTENKSYFDHRQKALNVATDKDRSNSYAYIKSNYGNWKELSPIQKQAIQDIIKDETLFKSVTQKCNSLKALQHELGL